MCGCKRTAPGCHRAHSACCGRRHRNGALEAIGESGTVKLNDEGGTTWPQEPLRSSGLVHLLNVGVMIAAKRAAIDAYARAPAEVPAPRAVLSRDPEGIMALSRDRFASGSSITVRIVKHEDHLRIALQHADGSEVSAAVVSPGDRTVTLPAPDVTTGEKHNLLASYLRGVSEQISVIPITVYPR